MADIDPMVDTGHGKASLPPYVNAAPVEEDRVLCIQQVRRLGPLCSAYNRNLAGPTGCLGIIIKLYIILITRKCEWWTVMIGKFPLEHLEKFCCVEIYCRNI